MCPTFLRVLEHEGGRTPILNDVTLKRGLGREEGIWLNRFWTVRRPSPDVLARIAEELGDDLEFFGGDPAAVIAVVQMLTKGRTFKASEHIRVQPDEVADLVLKAKNQT